MADEQLINEARKLQAKNKLKSAVYKLKAGVTLQKDDRVVLLAYLNKVGEILKKMNEPDETVQVGGGGVHAPPLSLNNHWNTEQH